MLNELAVRFFRWSWRVMVRRSGLFGLFSIVVLQLTLNFAVLGLKEVVGGLEAVQGELFWLIFLAILIGRWAGLRKRWWAWLAVLFLIGAPLVFAWMGDLGDEFRLVIRAADDLVRAFIGHLAAGRPAAEFIPSDDLPLVWFNLSLEIWTYADDLRTWFTDLAQGQPAFQARAVAFVWGDLIYAAALWAAAVQRRSGRELLALLPAGVLLLTTLAFARVANLAMLFLFLMGVLILVAARTQFENERRWQLVNLDHPEDMRLDFSVSSSLLISCILVVSIIVPYVNVRTFLRGLIGVNRPAEVGTAGEDGLLGESLGISRPTPPPPFFSSYFETGMPRSHLLGMPPELQHELVLKIKISGPGELAGTRFFWRSLAYDTYTGTGWASGETTTVRYNSGAEIPLYDQPYGLTIRQEVEVVNRPAEIAFAAGDLFSIDQPFEAAWYLPAPGIFDAFGVRVRARSYIADSQYPILHAPTLRNAGQAYPDWVTQRYLSLPASVPQRVRDLAVEVAGGAATPYDQARALESYLRRFDYTLAVPLPPRDRDLVDYFLFDLQRGYCDYYASSMVVLARVLGLPARLAIGYAEGRYDPDDGTYYVTGLNAHSWPEIYFPGFGWVPFEPTAGLADLMPLGRDLPLTFDDEPLPPLVETGRKIPAGIVRIIAVLLASAAVFGLVWGVWDRVRHIRQPVDEFYREVVQELYRRSRALGVLIPPRATPNELVESLAAYLEPRFRHFRWLARFPGSADDLARLSERYNRLEYSLRGLAAQDKAAGLKIWRALRWKIRFVTLAEPAYRRTIRRSL